MLKARRQLLLGSITSVGAMIALGGCVIRADDDDRRRRRRWWRRRRDDDDDD